MAIMSKRFEIIEAISVELECCIREEIVNESIDNLTSYSLKGWISGLHVNYWKHVQLLEKVVGEIEKLESFKKLFLNVLLRRSFQFKAFQFLDFSNNLFQ